MYKSQCLGRPSYLSQIYLEKLSSMWSNENVTNNFLVNFWILLELSGMGYYVTEDSIIIGKFRFEIKNKMLKTNETLSLKLKKITCE